MKIRVLTLLKYFSMSVLIGILYCFASCLKDGKADYFAALRTAVSLFIAFVVFSAIAPKLRKLCGFESENEHSDEQLEKIDEI